MGKAKDFFDSIVASYHGQDCLIWPYARQRGHACIKKPGVDNKITRVCTILCERQYGPKPDGMEVRHLCGQGAYGCVNQDHVVWGTHVDNCLDRTTHGTEVKGERNGQHVLTEAQALDILNSGTPKGVLARRYNVSVKHINDIRRGAKWRYLKRS